MVYKWYILPIGGLYATYHLLGEPETTIELWNPMGNSKSFPTMERFLPAPNRIFSTQFSFMGI